MTRLPAPRLQIQATGDILRDGSMTAMSNIPIIRSFLHPYPRPTSLTTSIPFPSPHHINRSPHISPFMDVLSSPPSLIPTVGQPQSSRHRRRPCDPPNGRIISTPRCTSSAPTPYLVVALYRRNPNSEIKRFPVLAVHALPPFFHFVSLLANALGS